METPPLRLDELGSVQFAQLCRELVGAEAVAAADVAPWGFATTCREGLASPTGARIAGPALVLAAWLRDGASSSAAAARLQRILGEAAAAAPAEPVSLLLLTNVAARPELAGVELTVLGPDELWAIVRERPSLRFRLPFLLGVSELSSLLPAEERERSTGDVEAATALARVFVPTRAYLRALAVLDEYRFVVLSGPPEMGKTAIARVLGLAALSDGWELHECVRPEQFWQRLARERRQLFVADDAFGSTEYRPETAERWAVELDRVLEALDERHRLIWTSRPTPLHAALRRIRREHGVERFPQPAQVAIDAAELDVAEKALILFRHTKALSAREEQLELVRDHGWEIVSHPHFTPERIRRFCVNRLAQLTPSGDSDAVAAAVAAEIREPTTAMAASYHALGAEHSAVLHALVDMPPGPVSRRELTLALRRHVPQGLSQPVAHIVDRLADHFLRTIGDDGVTWIHPSWRDLVIDELGESRESRQAFLGSCGIHGVALALSTAGGSLGERSLPLLREDADWDTLADRLAAILPTLEPPDLALLLETLAEALAHTAEVTRQEVESLARQTLAHLRQLWESPSAPPPPVALLAAWLSLVPRLPQPPPAPERALARAWIELVPGNETPPAAAGAIVALDDWLSLVDLLATHAPELLERFRFPAGQTPALRAVIDAAQGTATELDAAARSLLARVLGRVARLVPDLAYDAVVAASALTHEDRPQPQPEPRLRELSPELEELLARPFPSGREDRLIVARVLRDL